MNMVEHQGNLHQKEENHVSSATGITFYKAAITVSFKCHNKGHAKHACRTQVKGKGTKVFT